MTSGGDVLPGGIPPADITIDTAVAKSLLRCSFPDLDGHSLEPVGSGWDNAVFRVGRDYALRIPRHARAAVLIRHEQRWLPELAPALPLPVPVPERVGAPTDHVPWPWSVVRWLPGQTVDRAPLDGAEAPAVAAFLRALHQPAPPDAPRNPFRGVTLVERARAFDARLTRLPDSELGERAAVLGCWRRALAAEPASQSLWIHGDLHPGNLVSRRGRLAGGLDWGDVASGDPATDLAAVWMLFADETDRQLAFASYGADDALRARAAGWACLFAVTLLEAGGRTPPTFRSVARATLIRVSGNVRD